MSTLSFLLSPLFKFGALVVSIFASFWAVYSKGRQAGSAEEKVKSLEASLRDSEETQDAIKRANNARNTSATESDRGRLYDDDGFKRRD